jgi:hypothetical protein
MTHDTDATLRHRYDALLAARERSGAAPPAVPLERMLALVEGRGSERERLETLDAVMADAASVREFELLRALAANRAPARPATLSRRWAMWVLPSSLAAAAAIAFVALPALRTPLGGPDVVRGAAQGAVLIAPPLEATAAESRTFRWHAVPGAQRYAVEILTAGGTPVFTTRVADTTVTLPADVRLAPGVEHRWWVATELADGTQRRSPFRRLRVRDR